MKVLTVNIIAYILFPALIFYKVKIPRENRGCDVLTKDDSMALRGIAAIMIMFSHYLSYMDGSTQGGVGPAKLLEWFGGLGVCLFFFLSGYGLWFSVNKKSITPDFLYRRLKTVIPVYLVFRTIFGVAFGEYSEGVLSFIEYLLGLRDPLWFVSEILIIYVLFFLAAKIKREKLIIIMTVFLLIMSVVFLLLGFDARWYNANLTFVLGMIVAKNRERMLLWAYRCYWAKFATVFLIFSICAILFSIFKAYIWSAALKLVAGGAFSIIFVLLLIKIQLKSRLLLYIGKKSLHFYILHLYIWKTYTFLFGEGDLLIQYIVCIPMSVLATILSGRIEDEIDRKLSKKVLNSKK